MSGLITLMAAGIVALNAATVLGVVLLVLRGSRIPTIAFMRRYALLGIFVLSTLAVLGTLWMEYAAGLAPCLFCWWQRIFMYPIPLIALIALVKDTDFSEIADYVLALSVLGGLIALYQHLLQMLPQGSLIPCDASGDCAIRSVFEFHFVTIPWMALSVFVAFIFISAIARKKQ
jgi:disulfide bond formation protein DsbB